MTLETWILQLALSVAVLVVNLALILASAWYVPARLATLLGSKRRLVLPLAWVVGVVAALLGMLATPASSLLGFLYIVAGLVFMANTYFCLALLVLHSPHRRLRLGSLGQTWTTVALALPVASSSGVLECCQL